LAEWIEGENVVEGYDTLLISLEGRIVKPLSPKYLEGAEET